MRRIQGVFAPTLRTPFGTDAADRNLSPQIYISILGNRIDHLESYEFPILIQWISRGAPIAWLVYCTRT